jgi:hypothetical protein
MARVRFGVGHSTGGMVAKTNGRRILLQAPSPTVNGKLVLLWKTARVPCFSTGTGLRIS